MTYRSPRDIVRAAMRATGSSEEFLLSCRRKQDATQIRAAIYVVARHRSISIRRMSMAMGYDHSTAFYHLRARGSDPKVLRIADKIEEALRKPTWRDRHVVEQAHA